MLFIPTTWHRNNVHRYGIIMTSPYPMYSLFSYCGGFCSFPHRINSGFLALQQKPAMGECDIEWTRSTRWKIQQLLRNMTSGWRISLANVIDERTAFAANLQSACDSGCEFKPQRLMQKRGSVLETGATIEGNMMGCFPPHATRESAGSSKLPQWLQSPGQKPYFSILVKQAHLVTTISTLFWRTEVSKVNTKLNIRLFKLTSHQLCHCQQFLWAH